jgi:ADP-ribosylglycohydrolase
MINLTLEVNPAYAARAGRHLIIPTQRIASHRTMARYSGRVLPDMDQLDRARGALIGLALGDALGMPVQEYSREQVKEFFAGILRFRDAAAHHPYAHGLRAGRITDDTEQTFLVADLLLATRRKIEPIQMAELLEEWEQRQISLGLDDLLGSSTKRALAALRGGTSIEVSGKLGTTNGAAMRIAAVGIAFDASSEQQRLLECVRGVGMATHNTDIANAGATLVASLISRCTNGVQPHEALEEAFRDADLAQSFGYPTESELISESTKRLLSKDMSEWPTRVAISESVPTAIACVLTNLGSPWKALEAAVSLGGDTDTIASIAGGIAGSIHGIGAWPGESVSQVVNTNSLLIDDYAIRLLGLRNLEF